MTRIDDKFAALKAQGRSALITYIMAGDPNYQDSLKIMLDLPKSGADIIELGMPFSDPMADGPTIQLAGQRALKNGQTLAKTLQMVKDFRVHDTKTPIVMMGYYNPIYVYGVDTFLKDAKTAGLDGLLIVDLPPEMDKELCLPALQAGINFIRLATPTTDAKRLPKVLKNTSGFVYYVSMTGITGQALPQIEQIDKAVTHIKQHTDLPVVVGFGIKTADQVAHISKIADGVVVGSAIVNTLAQSLDDHGNPVKDVVAQTTALVNNLVSGL